MSMSCQFFESNTASDLLNWTSRGNSITNLLDTFCFDIAPLLVDIVAAFAFLWVIAGPMMGFIMLSTAVTYFYLTSKMITARARMRRELNSVRDREWNINYNALSCWSTATVCDLYT